MPAATGPLASRWHFYENEELAELARSARFESVSVRDDGGGRLLSAVH